MKIPTPLTLSAAIFISLMITVPAPSVARATDKVKYYTVCGSGSYERMFKRTVSSVTISLYAKELRNGDVAVCARGVKTDSSNRATLQVKLSSSDGSYTSSTTQGASVSVPHTYKSGTSGRLYVKRSSSVLFNGKFNAN